MTIAGILRDKIFSPNSNDLRIMQLVSMKLQARGETVVLYTEEQFQENDIQAQAIFSMARHTATLNKLQEAESQGSIVINPPAGVRRCIRTEITHTMLQEGLSMPRYVVLDLSAGLQLPGDIPFPCWLKRADTFTQLKDDVCFIPDITALNNHLASFIDRGIKTAIITEHVEGDLIKFYGVSKTPFFHWYYPTLDKHYGKFGLEQINSPIHKYPFLEKELISDMNRLAETVQVPVYGGDCIMDKEGNYQIIDFNDWPSFYKCAERASEAIVDYIIRRIRNG